MTKEILATAKETRRRLIDFLLTEDWDAHYHGLNTHDDDEFCDKIEAIIVAAIAKHALANKEGP